MPSYGLFLDLSGADKYPAGMSDGWGLATALATAFDQDLSTPVTGETPVPPVDPDPQPGSKPMPSAQEMDRLYDWRVSGGLDRLRPKLRRRFAI
jgi:hypothetical protein